MAEFIVTTLIDEDDAGDLTDASGGLGLSLREAVRLANENSSESYDNIIFQQGMSGLIRLTRGEIEITDEVTITGGNLITITGDAFGDDETSSGITNAEASLAGDDKLDDNSRIFYATVGVTLDGLTLTGGRTTENSEKGGAVFSFNHVTLNNSTISGNSTEGDASDGGGVFALGHITVTNSTISSNLTMGDGALGGGLFANQSVDVTNSTISGNRTEGRYGYGGGLAVVTDVTVTNSTISGNRTEGDNSDGGGVHAGADVTVINSTISGNRTEGNNSDGGGVHAGADVTVINSTISGNRTEGNNSDGGGVHADADVSVMNSIVLGNKSLLGNDDEIGEDLISGDAVITFTGTNIVGADTAAFDTSNINGEGSAANASAADVFAATQNNNIALAGVLANNGGPVQTIALKADTANTALDAVIIAGIDARGEARGFDLLGVGNGGTSDLGAFELQTQFQFAPTITSGAVFIAAENQVVAGAIMASDDKVGVSYAITGGADANLFAINTTTGALNFLTAPDFEAPSDTDANNAFNVEVTITDSDSFTASQALTVTLTNVNEAPVALASSAAGDEDTVISGVLTASDVDGDTLAFSLVDGPSNGSVTINPHGSFQFTPVADFNGTDSFIFQASDGALSNIATAAITINPVDEPVDPVDPVDPVNPIDPPGPVDLIGPTAGDDILLGTALNDTINSLAGNDNVSGMAGDDLLIGGGGNDSLKGAAGDDRLRGNGGDDTVKGGGGNDNLKGNGGDDFLRGNGGDDVIRAGGGNDNVKGGGGADMIFGGGGADQLNGGGGADTLRGNGGDDTLKGNGGADVFQFRVSDRNDTIADFRQGHDKIEIQNGAGTFEALSIEQDSADVLIGFGAGQVRVMTDNVEAFDESDFIF